MKKSVIIDKGNGLQQRLSYDDSTNKIIPETTFGPRQTDNVLPVVGKKFIDETDLSVAYGEDCLFCKGKKNTSGIPFDTQCAILSGFSIAYTRSSGIQRDTSLFSISYNGIPFTSKNYVLYGLYTNKGILVSRSNENYPIYGYMFYLQQPKVKGFKDVVNTSKINVCQLGINTIGECELITTMQGQGSFVPYKNPSAMKVIIDIRGKNRYYPHGRVKYINTDSKSNLNYIDIPYPGGILRCENNKVVYLRLERTLYWIDISYNTLTGSDSYAQLGSKYREHTPNPNQIPILGYERFLGGYLTNLFECTVEDIVEERGPKGG